MSETIWRIPCLCGASAAIERAHRSRDWSRDALVFSHRRAEDCARVRREFEAEMAAVPPHTAECDAAYNLETQTAE